MEVRDGASAGPMDRMPIPHDLGPIRLAGSWILNNYECEVPEPVAAPENGEKPSSRQQENGFNDSVWNDPPWGVL
jgi:hypothetical protein